MSAGRPRTRPLVPRRRVLDLLAERFDAAVTLVEAGAGFGKTTVVQQAIAQSADERRGREILIEVPPDAVGPVEGAVVLAAACTALGAPVSSDGDTAIARIADAVLAGSPRDTVIWVDDVHRLAPEAGWVRRLLDAMPANGHLALVGRTMPDFDIARFEVDGRVSRLGQEQLRFDDTERRVFADLRGIDASGDADGWPALMELEASVGGTAAIDYLVQEVLGTARADAVDALAALSSAEAIDQEMIDELTGFDGTLDELVDGFPLIRLEGDETGPRRAIVHDLLRDALAERLEPVVERGLHADLAALLLRRGDHAGAARRYAQLGDRDGIAAVADSLIDDLHYAAPVGQRLAAVDTVEAFLADTARALTLRGVTETITDPPRSVDTLHEAMVAARAERRFDLEAVAACRLAEIGYTSCRVDEARTHAGRVAELDEAGEPVARRLRFLTDIYLRRMTGRTGEIPALVDRWLADGTIADDEMRAVALFYRTLSLAYTGRVREALAEVDRLGATLPEGLFRNRLEGVIASQRWQLGELDAEGRADVRRLVERIRQSGQQQLFVEGAAAVAIFHATAGDLGPARELLAAAQAGLATIGTRAWSTHTVAQATATLHVIDGDEQTAAAVLEEAIPAAGPIDGLPSHVYFYGASLAYVLVPRTRPTWEALPVEPDLGLRLAVPKALVALREHGDRRPAAALPWQRCERIRPFAPEPFLVELAVAADSVGNDAALSALDDVASDRIVVLERLAALGRPEIAASARAAIKVTPRRPRDRLEVGVLGPLRIARNGIDETGTASWRRIRQRMLLALLLRDGTVDRDHVAAELWPDLGRDAQRNNFRVTLSHLLSALEPDRAASSPSWFVRVAGHTLELAGGDQLVTDVDQFRAHIDAAADLDLHSPRAALEQYLAGCSLYRGEYLAGFDDAIRAPAYYEGLRLRGSFVHAAVRAADLSLALGDAISAESLALRASEAEPLAEPARCVLARALLAQRRIGAAADIVRDVLRELDELDLAPEPDTRRLAMRLQVL